MSVSTNVVAKEKLTTPAGTFDTFKIEITLKYHPAAEPLSEKELRWTKWYAKRVGGLYVQQVAETRLDGRLQSKSTTVLQKYKLK